MLYAVLFLYVQIGIAFVLHALYQRGDLNDARECFAVWLLITLWPLHIVLTALFLVKDLPWIAKHFKKQ
jgi:hypothetical protein